MFLLGKVDQGPSCPTLFRQTPFCNPNLDEINRQVGNLHKPLSSVNMDELVKSVISYGEARSMQKSSSSASSSSSSASTFLHKKLISRKTIGEGWSDMVDQDCTINAIHYPPSTRKSSLGETTLEDFLVRTGVICLNNQRNVANPQPLTTIDPLLSMKQHGNWMHFEVESAGCLDQHEPWQRQLRMIHEAKDSQVHQAQDVAFNHQVMEAGFLDNNQLDLPFPLEKGPEATCTDPHSRLVARRKRIADEMMEKSMERRQRRMIKNRESAARSRARKQAHTNKLEQDVLQLRTINDWLKKRKEIMKNLRLNSGPGPKYQLRRTSSASNLDHFKLIK